MTDKSQVEEMKRYIFFEMSEEESDAFEDRYFEDAEYFYDLLELENDLIDCYAVGNLKGKDLLRFEKSLEKSPQRREKIADAHVLQTLIVEEKSKSTVVGAVPGFWEKISSFSHFQISGLRLAVGALAILLIFPIVFLFYQNCQTQKEFAEIERQREEQKRIEEQRRQNELNNQWSENSNINVPQNNNNQQNEDDKRRMEELPPSNRNEISNEVLAVEISPIGTGEVKVTPGKVNKSNVKFTVEFPKNNNYASIIIVSKGENIRTIDIPEDAISVVVDLPLNKIKDQEIDVQAASNTMGSYESIGKFKLKIKKIKK